MSREESAKNRLKQGKKFKNYCKKEAVKKNQPKGPGFRAFWLETEWFIY